MMNDTPKAALAPPHSDIMRAGLKALGFAHDAAALHVCMSELVELIADEPPPYAIQASIDLAVDGAVREGYLLVTLPAAPESGEGIKIGDEVFRIHARMHQVDAAGNYILGLLSERVGPPAASVIKPTLVTADAAAVERMLRSGVLKPGRGR